jgi:hypothetical protein
MSISCEKLWNIREQAKEIQAKNDKISHKTMVGIKIAKCEWKRLQTIALCGIMEEKVRKFANFETSSISHSSNLTFIIEFTSRFSTELSTLFFFVSLSFRNVALGLALNFFVKEYLCYFTE